MHRSFSRVFPLKQPGMLGLCLLVTFVLGNALVLPHPAHAQGTVPTFSTPTNTGSFTLVGNRPQQNRTTTIPTLLVPIRLVFQHHAANAPAIFDASSDVPSLLASPVFHPYAFDQSKPAQYTDALLRATFPGHPDWHTVLARPTVHALEVTIPAANGYILTSRRSASSLAVVDADFLQQQVFRQLPHTPGQLVLLLTHNTTFYAAGDATICCTWGTHGIEPSTGTSFVLGTTLVNAPAIVTDRDIEPLTQQLAEFFYDPRHNPQHYGYNLTTPGNAVPAWLRADPANGCGGTGIGSSYFLLQPTDTNPKNNIPAGSSFTAGNYHLQNVPLLSWYFGAALSRTQAPASAATGAPFSFPAASALPAAARPCMRHRDEATRPAATPVPANKTPNGHKLIGYWTGHGPDHKPFPLRDVPPHWDTVIVAFASPVKDAPEGTLAFGLPEGITAAQVKADIALLHQQGRKVLISLGGGGAYFTLVHNDSMQTFVSCVTAIVADYGFDGVDIDFESPSLLLDPGDRDPLHPTTRSIVHLIAGLRQLHDHFGPGFELSLVPEGPQIPGGFQTYGGQFGSYLPITHALQNILTFVDVQDYNTPPFEGLDGEIYQSHTVDYHDALTELVLKGFHPGHDPAVFFPPVPPQQVAVGFLTDYEQPQTVVAAMRSLLTGTPPAQARYRLQQAYPNLLGAMFWTIDDDRAMGYPFSNTVGPELHALPPAEPITKSAARP